MTAILSFDEALAATQGEDRALLVGNGFSARYFSYATLLAESDLEAGIPPRSVFEEWDTVDFEEVVRALEQAARVERAYGKAEHAAELTEHAQQVREALVHAVKTTHPEHRDELAFEYKAAAAFLGNFAVVFTLNYDLLLYWANLENSGLNDGFGLGDRLAGGRYLGPFKEDAYCHIFNLHGGLHLFEQDDGEVAKALDTGAGVISTIAETIATRKRLPVYVAEGTSAQKMRKINSVPYLRHCYQKLRANPASLFIYGHGAADNDAHIYRAIFESQAKHLYFGIYKPDEQKLRVLDGRLAAFQKTADSKTEYSFYDSGSANPWGD